MNDVIVIGAGPAGSHVAACLAGRGYDVLVLEEHPSIGKSHACTGIIGSECLKRFPVPEKVVLRRANSATFFSPSGESLRVQRPEVQAYIVDRAAFDSAMSEQAKAKGVRYMLDTQVVDLEVTDSRVTARVNHQSAPATFEAKTAVIASGFGSRLTRKVGLGGLSDFVMGAQAEVNIVDCSEVEVYFSQQRARGFFAWLVPLSSGRGLVGLFSRGAAGPCLRDFIGHLQRQGRVKATEAHITYGAIPLKTLPRTYGRRVLAVGDAAGQVKPTTGGGIYYGLLCADMAADTLDEAFARGDFSDNVLAGYQRKWKRRLGKELRIGYYARGLYERLGDSQIEELFHIVKSNGLHESLLQGDDFSFDFHAGLISRALGQPALLKALWEVKGVLLPQRGGRQ